DPARIAINDEAFARDVRAALAERSRLVDFVPEASGTGLVVDVRAAAGQPVTGADQRQADIIIDLDDAEWPVIRPGPPGLEAASGPDLHVWGTQAFLGPRAARWARRFTDEVAEFGYVVETLGLPSGGVALDVGCGTGRAVPLLREAVGDAGTVLA